MSGGGGGWNQLSTFYAESKFAKPTMVGQKCEWICFGL